MKTGKDTLWTIDELCGQVAEVLERAGYDGVSSGRVRDVPDERTIRYYTTLGLLDRPAAMRGRTGLYRPRHLFQLVAIKRLQARGLSLAEVQERVLGLSDAALRRLAATEVTAAAASLPSAPSASLPAERESRAESFWRVRSEPYEYQACGEAPGDRHISLDHGLELSLGAGRALDQHDVGVIRMAAAPLIEILRLRGLIGNAPPNHDKGDTR
jgi:DNA-binding transcriptional MerR regulator